MIRSYIKAFNNEINKELDDFYIFKDIKSDKSYPNLTANYLENFGNRYNNKYYDLLHYSILFLFSANDLYKIIVEKLNKEVIRESCFIGCINYLCLSVELLFKAILFKEKDENSIVLSHNLISLYKDLPDKYKLNDYHELEKFINDLTIVYGESGDVTRFPIKFNKHYFNINSYQFNLFILYENIINLFNLELILLKDSES